MSNWEKLGLILPPDPTKWWSKTHAALPCPLIIDDNIVRVYYSTRDDDNISRVTFADFDTKNPTKLIRKHDHICLPSGLLGSFDEHGVQATKVIKVGDKYILYYAGFRNVLDGYYDLFSGIATSKDGINFIKMSNMPFLDRISDEPNIRVAAVVNNYDLNFYTLFYIAATGWFESNGKKCPKYRMMVSHSNSFNKFENAKCVMEPNVNSDEIGFSRPWLFGDKLYYAVRKSEKENIPYAHIEEAQYLTTGVNRTNNLILERSSSGFDSQMVCFPAVLDLPGGRYMWYNGNGYGAEGIGLCKYVG